MIKLPVTCSRLNQANQQTKLVVNPGQRAANVLEQARIAGRTGYRVNRLDTT